jgi:hypothetical protein
MSLYKIISTTEKQFNGVIMPIDDSVKQGDDINVLGMILNVTQCGGGIITLANKTTAIVFQRQEEQESKPECVKDPSKLKINREVDLFFETKEIRLNIRNNLTEDLGLTYDCLYRFLLKEWETISKAFPEYAPLPMEHEPNTNNYCLINGWNWFKDYTLLLKEGCWSRKNIQGRHI